MTDLLARAAAAVYAVEPGEFVTTRKEWVASARACGDREAASAISALRKPSVSAWAMNAVVRRHPDAVARLRDLGARMRDAQSRLDMVTVQGLRAERDQVVDAFVAAAGRVSADHGRPLASGASEEVRASAIAALADAAAEEALSSGALARGLSYSGFGEVDLSDAVALTRTGRVLGIHDGGASSGARAESGGGAGEGGDGDRDRDRAAEGQLREARLALDAAEQELTVCREELFAVTEDIERLRTSLAAAERRSAVLTKRLERLQRRRDDAAQEMAALGE